MSVEPSVANVKSTENPTTPSVYIPEPDSLKPTHLASLLTLSTALPLVISNFQTKLERRMDTLMEELNSRIIKVANEKSNIRKMLENDNQAETLSSVTSAAAAGSGSGSGSGGGSGGGGGDKMSASTVKKK